MKKAVCYYRHSAEDKQENSIEIQSDLVKKFAKEHDVEIIGYESDGGVSGLTANRPGFNRLFSDWVEDETIDFDYVFVLDASRWGRFQNLDEAGVYEYNCTKKGRTVIYVDRGFAQSLQEEVSHSLIKVVDRYAAGEYSRQLSRKVWHGCAKIVQKGFSPGGRAPFGLSRQLLDEQRNPVRVLQDGEHKAISNQRVVFVPNEDAEIVAKIFDMYTAEGLSAKQISRITEKGEGLIRSILRNERYIGAMTYNKHSSKLKTKTAINPRKEWIIAYGVLEPIVSVNQFQMATFMRLRRKYSH